MQKNFAVSTIVGFLVLFLLGYGLYGVLLAEFFQSNGGGAVDFMRDPPVIWAIALGQLLFAVLLTLALGWKGVSDAGAGAKVAAVIGLLVAASYDLVLFGSTRMMNMTGLVGDVIVFTVITAVAGAAIAALMSRGSDAAPAA